MSDLWAKLLPDREWDVVVFYSGHGVPGLTDGKGYLLPGGRDLRARRRRKGIRYRSFVRKTGESREREERAGVSGRMFLGRE